MKSLKNKAFSEKLRLFCEKNRLYRNGEKTLVGFSGGADSLCLLHSLYALLGGERLVAVHVNHMLRGTEAEGDEAFCEAFCKEKGIPFIARRVDVNVLCGGIGFEEAARNVRYAVFREEAEKNGCTTVSLAHTASDNLETMLHRLCRGGGLAGLAGIPMQRDMEGILIVRPLLSFTREEILTYLSAMGLPHREDSTNADTKYTRNFIRHEIVPKLRAVNPAVEENAMDAAFILADAASYLEGETERFCTENSVTAECDARLLTSLPSALRRSVIGRMAGNAGAEALTYKQTEAVDTLLTEGKKGKQIALSCGRVAVMDGEKLRFLSRVAFAKEQEQIPFTLPLKKGKNTLPSGSLLYLDEIPPQELTDKATFHATIFVDGSLSLFARERREGESYPVGGMTRKLKKHLCGATAWVKKNRPVLWDGESIVWFPSLGVCDGKGGKTRVWYLEFEA